MKYHILCFNKEFLYVKLQQRTRVERVIGFVLAIWGILFYSRLLSTMTEQFRVSSWNLKRLLKLKYMGMISL